MANIGRMRIARMTKWVTRYFERQDEILRKLANRDKLCYTPVQFVSTCLNVETGIVTIQWSNTMPRTVTMPREMLIPSTLTLIAVHDC